MDSVAIAKNELKTKLRLHQIKQTMLVIGFVCLIAFFYDKWIEAALFCFSHYHVRKRFNKQYHSDSTTICMAITICVALFGIICTMPVSVSILSSIPVVYVFSWVGCMLQEKIDIQKYCEMLKEEIDNSRKISPENIEAMFIKLKTKEKYRKYLRAVLIDGMKDTDFFSLEENRTEAIDEVQYRRYKSKFLNNFPK